MLYLAGCKVDPPTLTPPLTSPLSPAPLPPGHRRAPDVVSEGLHRRPCEEGHINKGGPGGQVAWWDMLLLPPCHLAITSSGGMSSFSGIMLSGGVVSFGNDVILVG